MFASVTKFALAAAASAAILGASPASAALQLNGNGSVSVSGSGGGSVVLNMGGSSDGQTIPGLTSSITLNFLQAADGVYTFSYTLANTSTEPTTAARLNAFGFDVAPNVVVNGAKIIEGDLLSSVSYGANMPNGIGKVDLCFTTANCTGGGGNGLEIGQSASGKFSLDLGNQQFQTVTLDNFAVRYQAITAPVGSNSATGQLVTAAVPEPGTWALMLVGFGAIGMGMRRRRGNGNGLPQLA